MTCPYLYEAHECSSDCPMPEVAARAALAAPAASQPDEALRAALGIALSHYWEHDRNCGIDSQSPGDNGCNCGVDRDRQTIEDALAALSAKEEG